MDRTTGTLCSRKSDWLPPSRQSSSSSLVWRTTTTVARLLSPFWRTLNTFAHFQAVSAASRWDGTLVWSSTQEPMYIQQLRANDQGVGGSRYLGLPSSHVATHRRAAYHGSRNDERKERFSAFTTTNSLRYSFTGSTNTAVIRRDLCGH